MRRAFPPSVQSRLLLWFVLATASALPACVDPPATVKVSAATVDTCSGVSDGALCNDQNSCTTTDRCQGGLCLGMPAIDGTPCTDGNQCTRDDACRAGKCEGAAVVEGAPCTDGEPCTEGDACRMGRCLPGPPKVCDDGIVCTMDMCVDGMGCRFVMAGTCPDGDAGGAMDGGPPGDGASSSDGQDSGRPDAPDAQGDGDAMTGGDAADDGDGDDGDAGSGPDADGSPDGEDPRDGAGGTDAGDAADASATDAKDQLYEARGGACVCGIASAPSPVASCLGIALVALALTRRRPRR